MEVWGAQGGTAPAGTYTARGYPSSQVTIPESKGGYGGYSIGLHYASLNAKFYINVGGEGVFYFNSAVSESNTINGGYNGGGDGMNAGYQLTSSGGGATHISTVSGELKNLSSNRASVLIVAGGGGGSGNGLHACGVGTSVPGVGGNGGGVTGDDGYDSWSVCVPDKAPGFIGSGATQTSGGMVYDSGTAVSVSGTFGLGGTGTTTYSSGGGGGYYGGGGSNRGHGGAGGGSGYIGSSNLISGSGITKHMTCYSCSTSTAASTRTNSNTNVSATATADYSKTGNGYARITYLGTSL